MDVMTMTIAECERYGRMIGRGLRPAKRSRRAVHLSTTADDEEIGAAIETADETLAYERRLFEQLGVDPSLSE